MMCRRSKIAYLIFNYGAEMKRYCPFFILGVLAVLLAAASSHASVEALCFSDYFLRTEGKPQVELRTFKGIIDGPATIKVYNINYINSETEGISSAVIKLNGKLIFGPNNFEEYFDYLEETVILNQGDNSLKVLLRSKPYSKIKIEVTQHVKTKVSCPIADPFFIIAGVQTPIIITAFIPESPLILDNVELIELNDDGMPLNYLGKLNDSGFDGDARAGDQVFTFALNLNKTKGNSVKLQVAANYYGALSKETANLIIPIISIPIIENNSQYNQFVDDIFLALRDTRNNFNILSNPSIAPEQFSEYLSLIVDKLLHVYGNLEAIYRYETHSPSNWPWWLDYAPILGGLIKKARKAHEEKTLIENYDPNKPDPRTPGITWLEDIGFDLSDPNEREAASLYYEEWNLDSSYHDARRESAFVILRELVGQGTDLIGRGIGELYELGPLTIKALQFGLKKFIDIFKIKETNAMCLMVGEVEESEILQVPIGIHDIIFTFEKDQERAIGRNIPVRPDSPFSITIAPGEIKDFGGPEVAAWPMFGHDPQHTGRSSFVGPQSSNLLWRRQFLNNFYQQSPIVGPDNTIYISANHYDPNSHDPYHFSAYLKAIYPNGTLKWQLKIGDIASSTPAIGTNNIIYTTSLIYDPTINPYKYSFYLNAVNLDGVLKWRIELGKTFDYMAKSSPVLNNDNIIYITTEQGMLYSINPDGTLRWKKSIPNNCRNTPAIDSSGVIYITSNAAIYAYNPDGTLKFYRKFVTYGGAGCSSPSIGPNGEIYFGAQTSAFGAPISYEVIALDSNGANLWRTAVEGIITSPPSIDGNGHIYVVTYGRNEYYHLYSLNNDGSINWSLMNIGRGRSPGKNPPTIDASDTVYVCVPGRIYAIDQNKMIKWQTSGDICISQPAINSNRTLYVVGINYLWAFSP